jgi:hypothetical protein
MTRHRGADGGLDKTAVMGAIFLMVLRDVMDYIRGPVRGGRGEE